MYDIESVTKVRAGRITVPAFDAAVSFSRGTRTVPDQEFTYIDDEGVEVTEHVEGHETDVFICEIFTSGLSPDSTCYVGVAERRSISETDFDVDDAERAEAEAYQATIDEALYERALDVALNQARSAGYVLTID